MLVYYRYPYSMKSRSRHGQHRLFVPSPTFTTVSLIHSTICLIAGLFVLIQFPVSSAFQSVVAVGGG